MATKTKKKISKKQQKRRRRKILLIIEIIVLLLLLGALFVWMKFGTINFNDLKNLSMNKLDDETKDMLEGYTDIAFFGVDNRSNGNYDSGNSDSIMICSINNDTKEVKIVSVYRDTVMDVDGKGTYRKCNYAYNHGGAEEAVQMLNRNLDMDIEEYVSVDFNALVDAVDAVGGVDITITDAEVKYVNAYIDEVERVTGTNSSHISAGTQTLDGVQATAYCRVRYTAGGDFKRASRQRTVIEALINKLKGASPAKYNKLVNAIFPEIETSLKTSQIISLATAMSDYTISGTAGFPFAMKTGTFGSKGSLDVPCTLESNTVQLYNYLYGKENYVPSSTLTNISDGIVKFTGYTAEDAVDYNVK